MIVFERFGAQFGMLSKNLIEHNTFLYPNEIIELQKIKNQARKNEFIGVRQLRNTVAENQEISYGINRKPLLEKGSHEISISHSAQSICIGVSNTNIGIDIEVPSERVLRIRSKFCHKDEFNLFDKNSISDMTLLWTIKEAAYKYASQAGLDFKNNIRVLQKNGNEHICRITKSNRVIEVAMAHEIVDGQILTYTTS